MLNLDEGMHDLYFSFSSKAKKIPRNMSVSRRDLHPDSTMDVEGARSPEEEVIQKCDEMWEDMKECQGRLSLAGTETLTDSNAQLSLLMMQVKCLTAKLGHWRKETPEIPNVETRPGAAAPHPSGAEGQAAGRPGKGAAVVA